MTTLYTIDSVIWLQIKHYHVGNVALRRSSFVQCFFCAGNDQLVTEVNPLLFCFGTPVLQDRDLVNLPI